MSQTTLEAVFLRVAEAHKPAAKQRVRGPPSAGEKPAAAGVATAWADEEPATGLPAAGMFRSGWYVNGCFNVFFKLTPKPESHPPAYKQQCMCFMLYWIIPVPCCCCPASTLAMQQADPEAPADEEGAEVYASASGCGRERHVWRQPAQYQAKSPFGNERMRHVHD
eukprot:CAMPEP_0175754534 /NCGR_PEP_ID=MMETSP0097-20121207/62902_1 /TAXON_ID=311494 /ORGANISM="Alexandrium monilatum, Strain CCMP3105" /LENGTH=165 /DNA_ID=CAMNT_0017063497 /DNA_START=37 /DNA_END=534 /DNA_ORIENTATION=-